METSLLATKLFIPMARPRLVPRPRLMERLQAALTCRLTLVSAQAGYGKSTVLAQWISENKLPGGTAWVSLDEGDNDPVRFWDYFIASLRTIRTVIGETSLGLLHSPQPYSVESVLTALINDLASDSRDFVVVLDDYHLIKAEPVHAGVTFLLEHLPPRMHVIVATRVDPPLPLAHLRGRGQMVEIGADDLRFTVEETSDLLNETQEQRLSLDDIAALNAHTEGWAVGLKMAALSIRGRKDVKAFLATFTGSQRYVMDYLTEELLNQQPEEIREFLLRTSVLEQLTGALCDYLTGRGEGGETMMKLESSFGGFLVPLDESRQWYRYHHLLAGLLRHRLERVSGAAEVTRLHQLASQWYEDNQFPSQSVHHALAASDWERAMMLVASQSERRIKQGEWNTLLSWFKAIPDEILRTRPRLYGQYCNVLVTAGQFEAAEDSLSYLERTAHEDTGLLGEVALFRAILGRKRDDIPYQVEQLKRALLCLPPDEAAYRARASYLLGLIKYEAGQLEEAQSLLTDAFRMAREAADYWVWARAASHLGMTLWLRGKLQSALAIAEQAADVAGRSPLGAPPR